MIVSDSYYDFEIIGPRIIYFPSLMLLKLNNSLKILQEGCDVWAKLAESLFDVVFMRFVKLC